MCAEDGLYCPTPSFARFVIRALTFPQHKLVSGRHSRPIPYKCVLPRRSNFWTRGSGGRSLCRKPNRPRMCNPAPACGNFASTRAVRRAITILSGKGSVATVQWVRRQRQCALVLVLSLLLKLIVAGLHVPMAVAAAGVGPSGSAQDVSAPTQSLSQLIICTPSGIKTLIFDEDGHPSEAPTAPQVTIDCGLCSVLQAGSAGLTPDQVSATVPQITSVMVVFGRDAPCTPGAPRFARGQDPPQV